MTQDLATGVDLSCGALYSLRVSHPVFFDHASTTPISAAVREAMIPFETARFGNPSSAHGEGQVAARTISDARQAFADWFHVEPSQVIFTGGGTEADNLAIQGTALRLLESGAGPREILYSATEHPAVRETSLALQRLGFQPRAIPVDSRGQVSPETLEKVLLSERATATPTAARIGAALVSIQQVNNILGTLLPVEELARRVRVKSPKTVFHTDAVQAFGKVRVPTAPGAVDLVSLSAHKIQGPKAVGALVVLNPRLTLRPLHFGGGQEGGLRSGTQSAALIAGFHTAARLAIHRMAEAQTRAREARARLREGLLASGWLGSDEGESETILRWNSPDEAVPFIVSLSLRGGLPAAAFARLLEEEGFLISTGSACQSNRKAEPEPALAAIGLSPELASAGLRISFSADSGLAEVDALVNAFAAACARMSALHGRPSRRPGVSR